MIARVIGIIWLSSIILCMWFFLYLSIASGIIPMIVLAILWLNISILFLYKFLSND